MSDDRIVVGRMQVGACRLGERLGAGRVAIGNGEETHRRMLGREPRPQRADTPGPDHGDADIATLAGAAHHTTLALRSAAISAAARPSSPLRISSVCSPSIGGGRRIEAGVPENL
jgi:hypothetical protein